MKKTFHSEELAKKNKRDKKRMLLFWKLIFPWINTLIYTKFCQFFEIQNEKQNNHGLICVFFLLDNFWKSYFILISSKTAYKWRSLSYDYFVALLNNKGNLTLCIQKRMRRSTKWSLEAKSSFQSSTVFSVLGEDIIICCKKSKISFFPKVLTVLATNRFPLM